MNAEAITRSLGGARRCGEGWSARCPSHEDRTASLTVRDGPNGKLLVRCQAGCEQGDVIAALKDRGLWPEPPTKVPKPKARIVATYDYQDEAGTSLFQVCRFDPKAFRQRKPAVAASCPNLTPSVGCHVCPIEALTIFADNDSNGTGQMAADRCAARWHGAGREVRIVLAPEVGQDFNDTIRELGRAA
jgi:hypothetical protein